MATEIEAQTVRWIAELIGFPADAGGLLVSGGNMANFVCFLAARAAKAAPGRAQGRPVAMATRAARLRVDRNAHLDPEGRRSVRPRHRRDSLDRHRRRAADGRRRARRQIDADRQQRRAAVSGRRHRRLGQHRRGRSAARRSRAICRRHDVWFHVDGAYGALAARGARTRPASLRALGEADSVAVDPHKWLYAPLEAGCALVRRPTICCARSPTIRAYYHFDDEVTNYFDYGPQNSRGFRALKVWLALRQVGSRRLSCR